VNGRPVRAVILAVILDIPAAELVLNMTPFAAVNGCRCCTSV
jgi:hypothetical protein